jgi:hypothetical protein
MQWYEQMALGKCNSVRVKPESQTWPYLQLSKSVPFFRIISMRSSCSRAFRRKAAILEALRSSSPPNGELAAGGNSPLPLLLLSQALIL